MAEGNDPKPRQTLAGFRLLRLIGEGGTSSVYLAERVSDFQQRVALKIPRDGLHDAATQYTFRAEQRVLASLRHPEIVRLIDAGVSDDGLPYLVMEYVDGTPLDQYCNSRGLSTAERVALVARVLDAVEYAHQRQVAHCDLKFSNILVTDNSDLRLFDFGITKLLEPARFGLEEHHTQTAQRPFTLAFASPEQLQRRSVGTATDVYSIGVILYVLLTGSHPFEEVRNQPVELARAVISQDPEAPSRRIADRARRRGIEGDLDSIGLKALRGDPEARYTSAEEFAADLRNFLENRPVAARQGSGWYRLSKIVRRHRTLAAATALIATALVAGITGVLVESVRAQHSRTVAQQRFEDESKLTAALLAEFYNATQKLDRSGRALDMVVHQSRETLDRLAAESRGDPRLESNLSESYLRLAMLLSSRPAEAMDSIDRGLALADEALAADRGDRGTLAVKARLMELRSSMGGSAPLKRH